jgi:hypothetical protein
MESFDNYVVDSSQKNEMSSSSVLSNIILNDSFEDNSSLTNQIDQLTIDHDPIKALSSLILDQLNAQDTNAILEAQRQTLAHFKFFILYLHYENNPNSKEFNAWTKQTET